MNKRQKVKIRNFFKPITSIVYEKSKLTHEQRLILIITKQFIRDPKSKLRIGPLSSSRFVECGNVLIKIMQRKITIYHLNSKIDEDFQIEPMEEVIKLFDMIAENSRIILEYTYLTPVTNKLKALQK